jgi:hypothetical protein
LNAEPALEAGKNSTSLTAEEGLATSPTDPVTPPDDEVKDLLGCKTRLKVSSRSGVIAIRDTLLLG